MRGSASNVSRAALSALIALVLPSLFVRHMPPTEYGAWVLILQCSAYTAFLDLGIQTAIGKFIAEYDSVADRTAAARVLSSAVSILCVSALIGAGVITVVTWRVPQLFHQMPPSLIEPMREGILSVGLSAAFALPFGAFLAVFTGLQQYGFPTILALIGKILTSTALIVALVMHGRLIELAWIMAIFNCATAFAQFLGWYKYARARVGFSFRLVDRKSILRLTKYGSVLSVWTLAMLLISGMDLFIIGHYDFKNTAYYGTASTATNFMLLLVTSIFGPLLPAISSLQTKRSAEEIGEIVIRVTRYCTLFICLLGLPLLVGGYPLLKLWVGQDYAMRSTLFLEILLVGNAVRMLCYPYALAVMATGTQHLATFSAIAEASVNFALSLYLVQRLGAVGVAIGTLAGAFVSLGVHVFISMRLTRSTALISRRRFGIEGLLRPWACTIPTLLLLPFWKSVPANIIRPGYAAIWAVSTLVIAWSVGLERGDKDIVRGTLTRFAGIKI